MKFSKDTVESIQSLPRFLQELIYGKQAIQHKEMLEDILTEQARMLITGKGTQTFYANAYPDDPELTSLLPLAEHVNDLLPPVTPTAGFQNRLLHDLMRQAHAQQEQDASPSLWEEKRREIIIGATITSIISAAGVLAYILHITPFNRSNISTS